MLKVPLIANSYLSVLITHSTCIKYPFPASPLPAPSPDIHKEQLVVQNLRKQALSVENYDRLCMLNINVQYIKLFSFANIPYFTTQMHVCSQSLSKISGTGTMVHSFQLYRISGTLIIREPMNYFISGELTTYTSC